MYDNREDVEETAQDGEEKDAEGEEKAKKSGKAAGKGKDKKEKRSADDDGKWVHDKYFELVENSKPKPKVPQTRVVRARPQPKDSSWEEDASWSQNGGGWQEKSSSWKDDQWEDGWSGRKQNWSEGWEEDSSWGRSARDSRDKSSGKGKGKASKARDDWDDPPNRSWDHDDRGADEGKGKKGRGKGGDGRKGDGKYRHSSDEDWQSLGRGRREGKGSIDKDEQAPASNSRGVTRYSQMTF